MNCNPYGLQKNKKSRFFAVGVVISTLLEADQSPVCRVCNILYSFRSSECGPS